MDYFCLKLLSSSSWGCELKFFSYILLDPFHSHPPREDVSWNVVVDTVVVVGEQSSSSWGCELKLRQEDMHGSWKTRHPPREDVSWNKDTVKSAKEKIVILLVRMWVEINSPSCRVRSASSSSSWGCELKYFSHPAFVYLYCHPPREDVSWNVFCNLYFSCFHRHPPREDVSWNVAFTQQ